jgi:aminopeptidase N
MANFVARILADYCISQFSITHTDLTFELSDQATLVTNVMKITKNSDESALLELSGEQLSLKSIFLDDKELISHDYQLDESSLKIHIDVSSFTLTIVTEINPVANTSLEGLFKSGDAFCTQCEAEGFRRISYYLDRPDVMAIFSTKIIADKKTYPYLLSNGNKVDEGDLAEGLHYVTWQDPFPKPCYLFALVAGDFDVLTDTFTTCSAREIALEIFVDKGNLNKAHHAMASLKKSMLWDEQTFDLEYDLDIYMIVAVDFFNMGAMENKGLNVFNSKYVLADQASATDTDYFNIEAVIAHEYFHNWTGNRVTCRDWFQLSLKEGLTVFRDQQFSADMHSAAVTRIQNVSVLRSLQFAEDAGPMSHPIRPEKVIEMNNFYTLTVYEKGAEVIRMLHTLLGKENFKKGIDLYFKRHDGMAVTCDDFVAAMANASGVDLEQFKRWYSQSGTPELKVSELFDEDKREYSLTIQQVNQSSANQQEKHDLHIPVNIELLDGKNSQQHLLQLTTSKNTWKFSSFNEKPVVALLGGFSAPVKVQFSQSNAELEFLMVNASDEFNRWDAGQNLLTHYILLLVKQADVELPQQLIQAFNNILLSDADAALKAEQLTLPTFDELVAKIEKVNPVQLVQAINKVKLFLANGLQTSLIKTYQQYSSDSYSNDGQSIGNRALKNVCLGYLSLLAERESLLSNQYQPSDTMTDSLAAINCAAKNATKTFEALMTDFEKQWQDTALVMDKWFVIQASYNKEDIFERLTMLEQHPLFSLKNPNRARSLISAFTNNNPKYFHCDSGRGYQFLAKQIAFLNEINPQVASRLITPLIQFEQFDHARQNLMKLELIKLADLPNLSKDLKEKLDAALAG